MKLTSEEKSIIIHSLTKLYDSQRTNVNLKDIRKLIEKIINN